MAITTGYVVYKYPELDSTNEQALRLLNQGCIQNNTVIVAEEQIQGKGRNNNKWLSYTGNLHMSIVITSHTNIQILSQLPFVTALAIGRAIDNTQYKWPNDILLEGKKVCGILLESHNNNHIIIGIGVNVSNAPTYATYINKHYPVTIDALLSEIIENFSNIKQHWLNDGFSQVRKEWLAKAFNLEKEIQVATKKQVIKGLFSDIDLSGRLILKNEQGTHYINSGEVFL